uniref:Paralemmin n=1 Tax=Mola mola TaxID=94237 RepID=A0A3Q4B1G9_MOLML
KMDEAVQYKQRLEAIAEKRRLQEEQYRARREMEEEKLRLQQLKRKSLRDQWLMEGAPLSPTSQDSPHSLPCGSQAQDIEKHTDKLQSESQRLAKEEEQLKEQMESGQTVRTRVHTHTPTDSVDKKGFGIYVEEACSIPLLLFVMDKAFPVLCTFDVAPLVQNQELYECRPVIASEFVNVQLKEERRAGVSEGAPIPISSISEEEEEEGTVVMRAECVIITDEGNDIPEDLVSQVYQLKIMKSEEPPLLNPDAGQDRGETEKNPEKFTQPEKSEETDPTAETQPEAAVVDMQGGVKPNTEGQDKMLEDPTSVQVQPPAVAREGTTLSSLPVYFQSSPTNELGLECAAAAPPEGAEIASKAQDPANLPGLFHEVPLDDPQGNQRIETGQGEQTPLLSESRAPDNCTIQTGACQGEVTEAPKLKTCQCCSVL